MTDEDIAAAAARQRLDRLYADYPGEVAAAMKLAQQQATALVDLVLPIDRAP